MIAVGASLYGEQSSLTPNVGAGSPRIIHLKNNLDKPAPSGRIYDNRLIGHDLIPTNKPGETLNIPRKTASK